MNDTIRTAAPSLNVRQHNDFVNARFSMNNAELKLFISMLGRLQASDKQFHEFQIPVSELLDVRTQSKGGGNFVHIKKACEVMLTKTIQTETKLPGGKRQWKAWTLMSTCSYVDGAGYIEAKFNNDVTDFLLKLSGNFTGVQFSQLLNLKNFNAYRIYWMLKQHQTFQLHRTIGLEDLKEMLMLEESYPVYQNFRKRILEPVRKELEKTDMAFTYEEKRVGRAVREIRFIYKGLEVAPIPTEQWASDLRMHGVSADSLVPIEAMMKANLIDTGYIKYCIDYWVKKQKNGKVRETLSGAIFVAVTTKQLASDYELWQKKNPAAKNTKIPTSLAPQVRLDKQCVSMWEGMCEVLEDKISAKDYKTWFHPIQPVSFNDVTNELTLLLPSMMAYDWIEDKFVDVMREAVSATSNVPFSVVYEIVQKK